MTDATPGGGIADAMGRALARGGPAAAAAVGLAEVFDDGPDLAIASEAAAHMGLDAATPEGALATRSYVQESLAAGPGGMHEPEVRVRAEAGALYAAANPDFHADWSVERAAFLGAAAARAGELVAAPLAEPGRWAEGWQEAFPELTEAERALGDLPGFAAGVKEAQGWTETFPAEDPAHTGPHATGGPTPAPEMPDVLDTPPPEQDWHDGVVMNVGEPPKGFVGNWGALTPAERSAVDYLLNDAITPAESIVGVLTAPSRRTRDFDIDGIPTELKTVSSVEVDGLEGGALSDKLSGAIANRIMNGRGQASTVMIDVRDQSGISEEAIEQAVRRAFGADRRRGIDELRFIGPDYDLTFGRWV